MKKSIIVFGSSRSDGCTMRATHQVMEKMDEPTLVNLANYTIRDYDYEHQNTDDDFLKLITEILAYDVIILATPIYWYTMSASMKRFVDRITDLLTTYKELGKKLRGKQLAVITSYAAHPDGRDGFEPIFINTARYLGMKYLACYFHYSGRIQEILNLNEQRLEAFVATIQIHHEESQLVQIERELSRKENAIRTTGTNVVQ